MNRTLCQGLRIGWYNSVAQRSFGWEFPIKNLFIADTVNGFPDFEKILHLIVCETVQLVKSRNLKCFQRNENLKKYV